MFHTGGRDRRSFSLQKSVVWQHFCFRRLHSQPTHRHRILPSAVTAQEETGACHRHSRPDALAPGLRLSLRRHEG